MEDSVKKLDNEELNRTGDDSGLYHRNCAETLLMAANESYELGLDNRFIKAVCPFGGGIQCEKTCGAMLGAVTALGIMFAEDKPTNNEKMKGITKKFVEEVEKELGSLDCASIKAKHRSETLGCNPVKEKVAKIFEKVVDEL